MRKWQLLGAGLALMTATKAGAQAGSNCGGQAADACQMAVDVFQFLSPQLGLAIAGGNATLGSGSTLGGPGHFSIGVRANFFQGDLPDVASFPAPAVSGSPIVPSSRMQRTGADALPTSSTPVGFATADAAIGLFGGVPLPLTNVGGIDLLLSASFVPNIGSTSSDVRIAPERNLQLGYGVRVGLLKESLVVPGLSFTFLKRDLPTTTISGTAPFGTTSMDITIQDARVKTSAYRVVASKNLLVFGVAGGIGQDKYDESATAEGALSSTTGGQFASASVAVSQKTTRTNYFVDLSANFPLFKIVGELGQVTGGDIETFNEFDAGRADQLRTYGSVGLRIAF